MLYSLGHFATHQLCPHPGIIDVHYHTSKDYLLAMHDGVSDYIVRADRLASASFGGVKSLVVS